MEPSESDASGFMQGIDAAWILEISGKPPRSRMSDGNFWLDCRAETGLIAFMKLETSSSIVPKEARVRGAWIVFRLRVANSSLSAIAGELAVSVQAVSDAISQGSSERIERAVAKKLSLPVHTLFPERYDAEGRRIRRGKRTTSPKPRNVKGRKAA